MVTGLAWRTACQKASTVWPDRLRPERSVSVIDSITAGEGQIVVLHDGEVAGIVDEAIGGVRVVKGFGQEEQEIAHHMALARELGLSPGHKTLTPQVEACSSDFCRGLLRGLRLQLQEVEAGSLVLLKDTVTQSQIRR